MKTQIWWDMRLQPKAFYRGLIKRKGGHGRISSVPSFRALKANLYKRALSLGGERGAGKVYFPGAFRGAVGSRLRMVSSVASVKRLSSLPPVEKVEGNSALERQGNSMPSGRGVLARDRSLLPTRSPVRLRFNNDEKSVRSRLASAVLGVVRKKRSFTSHFVPPPLKEKYKSDPSEVERAFQSIAPADGVASGRSWGDGNEGIPLVTRGPVPAGSSRKPELASRLNWGM